MTDNAMISLYYGILCNYVKIVIDRIQRYSSVYEMTIEFLLRGKMSWGAQQVYLLGVGFLPITIIT